MKTSNTRSILLFFVVNFIAIAMNAQPILTSAASPPMGTKTKGYAITGNVTHTASGAAQTWNYAALAYDTSTFYFVEVPYSSLSQNIKDTFPKGNNASELIMSGSKVATVVGRMESTFQATYGLAYTSSFQKYAVADTFLIFPLHYQDSFDKRKYDSYGTLTTPFGTYTNVVRIREDVAMAATPKNKYRYLYFQVTPVYKLLMEYLVEKTTQAMDGKNFYNVETSTSGIENALESDIEIYPNPFTNEIIVNSNFGNEGEIILRDLTGKEILRTKGYTMNTSSLETGVYLLQVGEKNYRVVKN